MRINILLLCFIFVYNLKINNMSKFRKKPIVIEAITFEELVAHGAKVAPEDAKEHDGFAWSFDYKGHPLTHENNECYLIPTEEGTMNMTPKDVLITGVQGEIYPCKKDIFESTYDPAENDLFDWSKYNVHKGSPIGEGFDFNEKNIKANKQLRVNLDEQLQHLKAMPRSRERSLAITNLQQSIMWLGMDLKRLNEPNPYPDSYNPSNSNISPTADGMKM